MKQPPKAKPLAFVLMPFSRAESRTGAYVSLTERELDTVFELIDESLSGSHEVRRSDSVGDILKDIILCLDRADLVVADITSLNPNVMYELGIRHGFCKKTIILTQDRKEVPFDIAAYYTLEYRWTTNADRREFVTGLKRIASKLEVGDNHIYGPVHSHLGIKTIGLSEYEQRKITQQTYALAKEILWLDSSIDIWFALASTGKRPRSADDVVNSPKITALTSDKRLKLWSNFQLPSSLPSIDLYLSENYIPAEYNKHGELEHFRDVLTTLKNIKLLTDDPKHLANVMRQARDYALMLYAAVKKNSPGVKIFVPEDEWKDSVAPYLKDFQTPVPVTVSPKESKLKKPVKKTVPRKTSKTTKEV